MYRMTANKIPWRPLFWSLLRTFNIEHANPDHDFEPIFDINEIRLSVRTWKHFCILAYDMPHIYIPLGEFTWNVLEMNNSFRNDHFSENLITWSFSKNSLNSRTSLLSIQSCLENELFSTFRLSYFKNSLCSPFFEEFLSKEYELTFDYKF